MKKKFGYLFMILIMLFPMFVKGATADWSGMSYKVVYHNPGAACMDGTNDSGPSFNGNGVNADWDACDKDRTKYRWIFYNAVNNDGSRAGDTYCLSPGKGAPNNNVYTVSHVINPSDSTQGSQWQAFDVAATKAYQMMLESSIGINDGIESRELGELLFRWLVFYYGVNGGGGGSSPEFQRSINLFRTTNGINQFWDRSNPVVAKAITIYNESIRLGDLVRSGGDTAYDALLKDGAIWEPQFEYTIDSMQENADNTIDLKLRMYIKEGTTGPEVINWQNFTAKCSNGYSCNIVSRLIPSSGEGEFTIKVINSGNGGDYGLTIETSYYDPNSGSSNMVILTPGNNALQSMLLISPGTATIHTKNNSVGSGRGGGTSTKIIHTKGCTCDTTTGLYKVTKDKTTTTYSTLEEAKNAAGSDVTCPGTCEKKNTCYRDDSGKPHCKNGEVCTEEEFKKECQHSCQNPNESGDGKYYCKESTPGAGDGKECSKEEYIKDCQKCDDWEDKCKDNQNSSDPECQDYNQYCVDCTPNVYMPSTCNNFDNLDSQVNGVISDIAQTSAGRYSCRNDAPKDQIKSCVINRSDAAGNSYNATSTSGISGDNPYCQVWCKESYRFNVPTARTTNSGSYFTIDASIEGTRDCYVSGHDDPSKGIDKAKFEADFAKAEQELVDAWNEYNHWKVGSELSDKTRQVSDSNSCCTATCTDSDGEYCCSYCNASETKTQYYYEWDYTVYNVNGQASTQHQSELTNGYASCFCCGCNGVDGHSLLNEFAQKRDSFKVRVEDALKNLRNIITNYNSCTGTINNPNETSVNVTGWDNKMVDWSTDGPEIYLNYKEDYINDFNTMLDSSNSNIIEIKEEYCFGETDSTYKCVNGGSASSSAGATDGRNVVFCYTADDSHGATCIYPSIQLGKSNWIRKTKVQSAHYEPNNALSVRSQYGTIQFKSAACNGNDCLYTNLPSDSIPVSLLTKTGVFPFVLSYNKVGQSNQDNSLGRIINTGSTKSVLTEYTRKVNSGEYKKCSISTMQQQVGYVCHYLTNCDDHCKFKCDPDGKCYFEECEDGNCTFSCRDCIFDGGNFTYSFRPVSLSTLFPNERSKNSDEGYNWTNDYKGQLTRKIIENGYNRGAIKLQGGDESYVTPEYSYTMSAINLKNIKDYNSEVGTFANSTIPSKYENMSNNTTTPKNSAIYCSNMSINGIDYSVKCNSAFLDVIENDASHKFAIASVRPDKSQRFVLFTDLVSVDPELQKTCANNKCITRENAIGPSWK